MPRAEKLEELIEISKPVAEFLQKNFHPHTTVVVEVDGIRVEETLTAEFIKYEPE